ncbi:IspD/TarI family cytidylyltransferase [Ruminococcus sp.]|uniref:IspD/TarI family cytidylyltransferase n=1 Tax=Ruminococcus sp. TaxID=41978 RepID=UPI0025D17BB0|nr:IspD/TarI family cytidylyltransferase [Ruminococcus sp.]MBQ6252197.1 2-C-methyl-D-erythritol 4-phosphate cytidylyltransferase [Ruminococcus sp.]MBR3665888.1 2-C-methyl-D-erythritol 4-phosphate cytidylyltransferase [Ruminococcus sp.]MBR6994778.1 2-C-methyl-D-erythritol 4-phosphate cytidylyltransferase [Ruminococcus sp.]
MSNVAVIFAGGTGQRMNSKTKPKQFLELHGKPILVYTIEHFQRHKDIDGVVLVILESWIDYCNELVEKFRLTKVRAVIAGGDTGQASICNGIKKAAELFGDDSIVLIHDGVRPLIDEATITADIECAKKNGNAITVTSAIETVSLTDDDGRISDIFERSRCCMARAPQCFVLKDIIAAHERAIAEGNKQFIDSASMMRYYGHELYTVPGAIENIKITTPSDYYIFRAIVDAREDSQIFGL